MTPEFVMTQLRAALLAIISYGVGAHWFTPAGADALTQVATAIGPLLIPLAMTWYANAGTKKVPHDSIAIEPHGNSEMVNSAEYKGMSVTNMSGKIVGCLLLLFIVFPHDARAAEKQCDAIQCSGWYVGANLMGIGSNADIIGSGINGSVFAAGGMVGIQGGYQMWNGKFFAAAELTADYSFSGGVASAGQSKFFVSELVKVGMGINGLFANGTAPSQGPVNIPTGLASSLIAPYAQFGGVQRAWGSGWASGAGAQFTIGGGWNLDLSYLYVKYDGKAATPDIIQKSENLMRLSVNRMF